MAGRLSKAQEPPGDRLESSFTEPLVVGLAAAALGLPWYVLIVLVFAPTPAVPFWIWMAAGVGWGTAAFLILRRWARAAGWGVLHDWALAFGALMVNMGGGYLGSNYWPPIDLYAKIVLNVIAVACMIVLAGRLRQRRLASG